jgi:hypothetical protein
MIFRMNSIRIAIGRLAIIVHAIGAELRRLNNARIDSAGLAAMPRCDRARIVKSALVEHHRHPNHCC